MILFEIVTLGGDEMDNIHALVPEDKVGLSEKELDAMHNVIINYNTFFKGATDETQNNIALLYKRFGLEASKTVSADLKQYVGVKPPFTVDRIVRIGWAV